jgi:hypothetical protein
MKISITWPGGEHDFLLGIGELRALQSACDAGPEQIFRRLGGDDWRVDDVLQTLRLGLIGAGMDAKKAASLVTRMYESHPKKMFNAPARLVLMASLVGDPDDPLGEAKGEPTPPENGGSAPSTEPEPA